MAGKQAPDICICLAKSPACQGSYVGISIFVLVGSILLAVIEAFEDTHYARPGDDCAHYTHCTPRIHIYWGFLLWLLLVVPPIVMSASRLCVPACCRGGMEAVPGCCPYGCFAQLDTPSYVLSGFSIFVALLDTFLVSVGGGFHAIVTLLMLVIVALINAVVATTIVKLCIMSGSGCQQCLPTAMQQISAVTPVAVGLAIPQVVVGQPIAVHTDAKQVS